MRILYFDCCSGASGDMILGALIDAGVPIDDVRRALGGLAIDPETVWTERVVRAGVSATKFQVRGEDAAHDSHHSHGHDSASHDHAPASHSHRTLAEIGRLIDRSELSANGKNRAGRLFARLGEAEAAIHGVSLDRVHLHEVGAIDSIIDIVGTVFAMEWLGLDRIVASPLNVGGGTVHTSHGEYPVPAPATMHLLQDVPVYAGSERAELVTPTGALLVREYASAFGPLPPMRVRAVGYGAGARDFPRTPNVLRVLVGDADGVSDSPPASVVVIEAEIDDMNPQLFGAVMDKLLADGALDVFYTPIQMKKNRPGTLITVLAPPALRDGLSATIFRETTTLGVRHQEMARECLDREMVTVQTPLGTVRIKVARRHGEIVNVSPEFEDCLRLAAEHNRPVKEVQTLASSAFVAR